MSGTDPRFGDVLVVGAGISGIQAALDLATSGFKVFLLEKAPTIGGKMAQLDKTFPTNDCSMCIESPKFIECDRHPNIEILTWTEVERVEGEAGDFTVTVKRKPRYVDEDACTGCTTCAEYCPVRIPDPFNQGLSERRAASVKKWLLKRKIPAKRLLSKGHGLTRPIAPNETEEGRAKNRRVDFVIQ